MYVYLYVMLFTPRPLDISVSNFVYCSLSLGSSGIISAKISYSNREGRVPIPWLESF